jgi:hypothetical protein
MIGFISTRNQPVYVNPAHVAYVAMFEPGVTIIALAVAGTSGKPLELFVRGELNRVQAKLAIPPMRQPLQSSAA